jgi:hypothetical protein
MKKNRVMIWKSERLDFLTFKKERKANLRRGGLERKKGDEEGE